jgi:hypothetical protein
MLSPASAEPDTATAATGPGDVFSVDLSDESATFSRSLCRREFSFLSATICLTRNSRSSSWHLACVFKRWFSFDNCGVALSTRQQREQKRGCKRKYSHTTHLLVQSVQAQRLIPVLLQLMHQLPALLHPLLCQLRALVLLRLVLLQLVFHVEQAAAELAEDVLWRV